jgi:hypothetical protein
MLQKQVPNAIPYKCSPSHHNLGMKNHLKVGTDEELDGFAKIVSTHYGVTHSHPHITHHLQYCSEELSHYVPLISGTLHNAPSYGHCTLILDVL